MNSLLFLQLAVSSQPSMRDNSSGLSQTVMRFTFPVLISTTSLYKHKEPPNSLKQGCFAALRSPEILSFLKMCTLPESRKRPALRGFVGGGCALGCTFLYHSAIFERAYPDENAAKTKRRTFSCRGIHALPVSVKAHTAPHAGKHGLQFRCETLGLH